MKNLTKVAIALVLVALVVWKVSDNNKQHPRPVSAIQNAEQSKGDISSNPQNSLVVTSAIQSSFGATADDINAEFISTIEDHFVQESKKQYQVAMESQGYTGEAIDYEAVTVLFDEQGEKLAVTTLKAKNASATSKVAWWISGGEMRRAVCIDMNGNEVPIRFGACAAKISEIFGYNHWALDSKVLAMPH